MASNVDRLANPHLFLQEAMRRDFRYFLRRAFPSIAGGAMLEWNWHHDAIAHALAEIVAGNTRRQLFTLPPRNLKSIMISVAWVAWMLGRDPTRNFVCVSYSNPLAFKHASDCLAIMQSPWYRELFPRTVIAPKRAAIHDFETTQAGGRLATSITGTLTGRGGDIIVIDDPIKPDDAYSEVVREGANNWYQSTLSSRLNDKAAGAIVTVMQRLHERDLTGMLIEAGGWEHLSLPAIATEISSSRWGSGRCMPAASATSCIPSARGALCSRRCERLWVRRTVPAGPAARDRQRRSGRLAQDL
jgi:hypothetical protein